MKKALVIIMAVLASLVFLYAVRQPSPVTMEEAVETVKNMLDDKSKETITNFDNPKAEEVLFETQPSIYLLNQKTNLAGKSVYKITFNTTQDGLLGPMVFYVDKKSGEIVGMGYRE